MRLPIVIGMGMYDFELQKLQTLGEELEQLFHEHNTRYLNRHLAHTITATRGLDR